MNPRQRSRQLADTIIDLEKRKANGVTEIDIDKVLRLCYLWINDTGFGPQDGFPVEENTNDDLG